MGLAVSRKKLGSTPLAKLEARPSLWSMLACWIIVLRMPDPPGYFAGKGKFYARFSQISQDLAENLIWIHASTAGDPTRHEDFQFSHRGKTMWQYRHYVYRIHALNAGFRRLILRIRTSIVI